MATYKTTGIILRRTNYSEADRIITFITPNRGKLEAIAKGVRKPTAKLASHLELFTEISLMLASGRNLDVVTSARATRHFSHLSQDYERMRRAYLFCEMAHKLTGHDTSARLYKLLVGCLAALGEGIEPAFTELYFKLHLLEELGHKPSLNAKTITQTMYFDFASGGLGVSGERVTRDEVKLLRLLYDFPLNKVAQVKGIAAPAQSILGVIDRFYDYLFNQHFRSAEI